MVSCIIKMMSGSVLEVTEKQLQDIRGKVGMVHISSLDRDINMSSVEQIMKKEDYLLEKADKNKGTLHDGQKVVRKFGRWYLESDQSVWIDPQYYPEIAQDCVPSLEEFNQKYLALPEKERLELMLNASELKREPKQLRSGNGSTKI